jgi:hypothetical protein
VTCPHCGAPLPDAAWLRDLRAVIAEIIGAEIIEEE